MKTETEIAKERTDEIKEFEKSGRKDIECRAEALGIKQSDQRWLKFLEGLVGILRTNSQSSMKIDNQITDLKQAIKIYEDDGI